MEQEKKIREAASRLCDRMNPHRESHRLLAAFFFLSASGRLTEKVRPAADSHENRLLDSKYLFVGDLSSHLPNLDLAGWFSRNIAPNPSHKTLKKVALFLTKPTIFDFY